MNRVERPTDLLTVRADDLNSFDHVLIDRDGVLGDYGAPIDSLVAEHTNNLISTCTDKKFTIVTNGNSDTEPINADVIRTPLPRIKQINPWLLKGIVEDPRLSLFITDSFSETISIRAVGFNVFYLQKKFTPHPYEETLRKISQPLRAPVGRLAGL